MLPKTEHAVFSITLPSTKKKANFRRFLSKEEKILLIAKESDDRLDKLQAMRQVVNNCLVDDIDVDKMTSFDFDYVFMKLRAQSVDNLVEIQLVDEEDGETYPVTIDLNTIEIAIPRKPNFVINVDDKVKLKLKYPTLGDMIAIAEELEKDYQDNLTNEDHEPLDLGDLLYEKIIDSIYDDETVYDDYSRDELFPWLDQLSTEVTKEITDFLQSIPDLEYKTTYKTKLGTEREVELRGIDDFFTL
jgi:hypothetical protein